ncbi:MAG: DUF4169 family protein [Planktotalea sp.]|jgi:hypothetical protein|uniref:DUF4169 family protein n=1 Tax=Planktotalea sp. TaxID=2029877 RepID=UPI00030BFCC1|nr:DUF4169 family protein [Planktotalea sp.]MDG1075151.1 DUF4169 family protein [Planktotalea sp.]MDG1084463.1 DUF4169 family protein [Planktotalea sp.]
MNTPVNLNRFRKQKARADDKARADQNAALHGLSKAQRELEKAKNTLSKRTLNGLERDKLK